MLWKCCTQYASKFGKLSSGQRTGKGQFHSNPKERQCQRMLKLPHKCTHLAHYQSNAQNSPSQVSTVYEPWSSKCSSWILKSQRNQSSNCQHLLDHIKSKRISGKYLFLLYWICQSLWLCGSQQTVENSLRNGNTNHLTCLLRNLYAGQEATSRTGHGTTDWF